jgi:hypothetical protein
MTRTTQGTTKTTWRRLLLAVALGCTLLACSAPAATTTAPAQLDGVCRLAARKED